MRREHDRKQLDLLRARGARWIEDFQDVFAENFLLRAQKVALMALRSQEMSQKEVLFVSQSRSFTALQER